MESDVRELREIANLSQAALGTALGVSRQTILHCLWRSLLPATFIAPLRRFFMSAERRRLPLSMPNMILVGLVVTGAVVAPTPN